MYLHDILIYSRTKEEHDSLLDEVFHLLQDNGLYIRDSKCALYLESVEFLGHVIIADGVAVDSGKTNAVQCWP